MTPKEALEIIIKATAVVQMDRASHKVVEQALSVMEQLVNMQSVSDQK